MVCATELFCPGPWFNQIAIFIIQKRGLHFHQCTAIIVCELQLLKYEQVASTRNLLNFSTKTRAFINIFDG